MRHTRLLLRSCCFLAVEPREDWEQVKFPHGSAAAAAESTRPRITIPSAMHIDLELESLVNNNPA